MARRKVGKIRKIISFSCGRWFAVYCLLAIGLAWAACWPGPQDLYRYMTRVTCDVGACCILPNVVVRLSDRSLLFRLVSCRLVCLLFVALFGVEMCTTYLVFCEGVLVDLRTRFSDGYLLV